MRSDEQWVEGYREQCQGDWLKLAGDQSVRPALCGRLLAAGRPEVLVDLVTGSDAWARARLEAEGSYEGYLADLDLVWRWAESGQGWNVGLQLRCLLIESSIRTSDGAAEIDDASERVEFAKWLTWDWPSLFGPVALDMALELPDDRDKARALSALLIKRTPDDLKAAVLNGLLTIEDIESQATSLGRIVSEIPGALRPQVFNEQFLEALATLDEGKQAWVFGSVSRFIPGQLMPHAVALARQLQEPKSRVNALAGLVVDAPEEMRSAIATDLLAAMREIEPEIERLHFLVGLITYDARRWPVDLQAETLDIALHLGTINDRMYALSDLMLDLPVDSRGAVEQAISDSARNETDPDIKVDLLGILVRSGSAEIRDGAIKYLLEALAQIASPEKRCYYYTAMIGPASAELRSQVETAALEAVKSIQDARRRALVQVELAQKMPHRATHILLDALNSARDVTNTWMRANTLTYIIEGLSDQSKSDTVAEVLNLLQSIDNPWIIYLGIRNIAAVLPDHLKPQALQTVQGISSEKNLGEALVYLTDYLLGGLALQALAIADNLRDPQVRATTYTSIALHQSKSVSPVTLEHSLSLALAVPPTRQFVGVRNAVLNQIAVTWRKTSYSGFTVDHLRRLLRGLARDPRDKLLQELQDIKHLIAHIGGVESLAAGLQAVRDVGHWWP